MPRYNVTLTEGERKELERFIQRGKGYRIRHAQVLLKLDHIPENVEWTYDRIKSAYNASNSLVVLQSVLYLKVSKLRWAEKNMKIIVAR